MSAPRHPDMGPASPVTPENLTAWFTEFHRLAAEAAERFEAGEIHPAMASLAAVPMIHKLLLDGCDGIVHSHEIDTGEDDTSFGLYL